MRRRLVWGGVAVVALTLLLFAVPLGFFVRSQVIASGLDGFAGTIEQTATLVDERSRTCAEVQVTLSALAREDVAVTVFDRSGDARFVQRSVLEGDQVPVAGEVVRRAAAGATGSAYVDGHLAVAVPLSTPVCGERLVLQGVTSGDVLAARVRRAWLLLGLVALGAVAAGGAVAAAAGRRFARPLEALAGSARQLGDGDFTARAPRSGMEEADAIAAALDRTADRLGRAVARGTAFAADASHQLRTPLTALRLHLESARASSEDPGALDAALAEADRLEATITELVELTHLDAEVREVDLGALVHQRAEAWTARAQQAGRQLRVTAARGIWCTVRPTAVAQALEVLVDNALTHGVGRVEVRVTPPGSDAAEDAVRIHVTDEGAGMPADALVDRSDRGGPSGLPVHGGRGLSLARDLVEAEGGRLVLGSDAGTTSATVVLPAGDLGG